MVDTWVRRNSHCDRRLNRSAVVHALRLPAPYWSCSHAEEEDSMSTTNEVAASADTRFHLKQTTRSPIAQRSRAFASRNNMWIALALAVGGLSLVSESFRSTANLQNVLAQNGIIGIVAIGMLVMMISGG